ncbi:expressed unknown protein [Seminavis robusta]|uniref:Uncharacterized protein n=1 Tax=Seminavis robusta TaxID=568900 RepID=A0A9N8H7S9_9STRA|nr:expressed unknown protein [Seminavis robusta]|eukprot:Sro74_g040960.1 n/a (330) ;mRNA; f:128030-129019
MNNLSDLPDPALLNILSCFDAVGVSLISSSGLLPKRITNSNVLWSELEGHIPPTSRSQRAAGDISETSVGTLRPLWTAIRDNGGPAIQENKTSEGQSLRLRVLLHDYCARFAMDLYHSAISTHFNNHMQWQGCEDEHACNLPMLMDFGSGTTQGEFRQILQHYDYFVWIYDHSDNRKERVIWQGFVPVIGFRTEVFQGMHYDDHVTLTVELGLRVAKTDWMLLDDIFCAPSCSIIVLAVDHNDVLAMPSLASFTSWHYGSEPFIGTRHCNGQLHGDFQSWEFGAWSDHLNWNHQGPHRERKIMTDFDPESLDTQDQPMYVIGLELSDFH